MRASTAIAALHGARLRAVAAEDLTVVLRLLADRRDQLSQQRNRVVCRMHDQFRHLQQAARSCTRKAGATDTTSRV